jgi:hypothetical protein
MINLSLPIDYPDDTPEMKRIESEEFSSMLLTCLLAAELNADKPNTAVRKACGHMLKRFQGERTRKILAGAMSQALPLAYIHKLVKLVESECGAK